MKTLKEFAKNSNIDEKLVRAVVKQLGGWESFKTSAPDITNHGIDGGFGRFIYYTDTVKFAQENKKEILRLAEEMARDMGEVNAYQLIAGFNCLKDDKNIYVAAAIWEPENENAELVLNALAWFAGEEVAREYMNLVEVSK
jgi:hypothetical protein